jgi:hypothetical protein
MGTGRKLKFRLFWSENDLTRPSYAFARGFLNSSVFRYDARTTRMLATSRTQLLWAALASIVSVTPSTSVRAGGNVVGGIHDIYGGGARPNHESGRAGSCAGIARASIAR